MSSAPAPARSTHPASTTASTPTPVHTTFTASPIGASQTGVAGPVPSSFSCAVLSPATWLSIIGVGTTGQNPTTIGWNWGTTEGAYDCTGTFNADATQPDGEVMIGCGQIAHSLNGFAPVGQITKSKKEMRELTRSGIFVMVQGSWSSPVSASDALAALKEALRNAEAFGCPTP